MRESNFNSYTKIKFNSFIESKFNSLIEESRKKATSILLCRNWIKSNFNFILQKNLSCCFVPGFMLQMCLVVSSSTQGPSNLNQKSFWKMSSTFGDKCPQNGSKNEPTAPTTNLGYPHEGPSVDRCRANVAKIWQPRQDSGLGF